MTLYSLTSEPATYVDQKTAAVATFQPTVRRDNWKFFCNIAYGQQNSRSPEIDIFVYSK